MNEVDNHAQSTEYTFSCLRTGPKSSGNAATTLPNGDNVESRGDSAASRRLTHLEDGETGSRGEPSTAAPRVEQSSASARPTVSFNSTFPPDVSRVSRSRESRSPSISRKPEAPPAPPHVAQNGLRSPSPDPLSISGSDLTPEISTSPQTSRSSSPSVSRSPSPLRRSGRIQKMRARISLPPSEFDKLYPRTPTPERGSSVEDEREEDEESFVDFAAQEQEEGDDHSGATSAHAETSSITVNEESESTDEDVDKQPTAAEELDVVEDQVSPPGADEYVDEPDDLGDEPPSSLDAASSPPGCTLAVSTAPLDSRHASGTSSHPTEDSSEPTDISPTFRVNFGDAHPIAEGSFHLSAASTWARSNSPQFSDDTDDTDELDDWGLVLSHSSVGGNFGVEDQASVGPTGLGKAPDLLAEPSSASAGPKRTVAVTKQAHSGGATTGTKRKRETRGLEETRGGAHHHADRDSRTRNQERAPDQHTHAHQESANAQAALIMSLMRRRQAQVQSYLAHEHGDEDVHPPDAGAGAETDDSGDESEEEVLRCLKRPRKQGHSPHPSRSVSPTLGDIDTPPAPPKSALLSSQILGDDSALVQVDGSLFHLSKSTLEANSEYFADAFGNLSNEHPDSRTSLALDPRRIVAVSGISAKDFQTTMLALSDIQYVLRDFTSTHSDGCFSRQDLR